MSEKIDRWYPWSGEGPASGVLHSVCNEPDPVTSVEDRHVCICTVHGCDEQQAREAAERICEMHNSLASRCERAEAELAAEREKVEALRKEILRGPARRAERYPDDPYGKF